MDLKFILDPEPLEVKVLLEGRSLAVDVLPDGLKSVVSWIADLLMRLDRIPWVDDRDVFQRNLILFLDEIDIHLHPKWQRRILPAVQQLFPNAQIFVSTHSPFVVGSIGDARVYSFSLKGELATLEKATETRAGSSYSLVLDEIFEVDEAFDIQTETQLDLFYELKENVLRDPSQGEPFLELAGQIAGKSLELSDIVGRELRQLSRITGKEYDLS